MEDNDYIMHYGVLGMKWGVRKRKARSISSTKSSKKNVSNTLKAQRKQAKQQKKKIKEADSAAKLYYKADTAKSSKEYQKYKKKLDKKEARLDTEQIVEGRRRVAQSRAVSRKVLATAVSSATAGALAATGMTAVAPILGTSVGNLTNGVSGLSYYERKVEEYTPHKTKLDKI